MGQSTPVEHSQRDLKIIFNCDIPDGAMFKRLVLLPWIPLLGLPCACADESGESGAEAGNGSDATGESTAAGATAGSSGIDPDSSGTAPDPSSDDTGEPVACEVTPGAWAAPDWDANTVDALAVRAALDALTGDALMRGAETGAVELAGLRQLEAAWAGDPSLADIAHPGFVPVVEQSLAEFVDVIAAGEQDLIDAGGAWDPGAAGGVWGDDDRGINEGGLEVRQLVDKGGFGGGILYAYAVGLTEAEITPATIDAIAAAWGSNATLDPEAMPTDAASYAFQMGFHGGMAESLAIAKAYAADPACTAERDAALVAFFRDWELTMYARLVFYGGRATGALLAAATDTEFAAVLHDLGEGTGVGIGFLGMPDPAAGPLASGARIIDDAAIEAAMTALGVDVATLGASSTGLFVESLPALEDAVGEIEGVIMDAFGVDAATIQSYRMPTPG